MKRSNQKPIDPFDIEKWSKQHNVPLDMYGTPGFEELDEKPKPSPRHIYPSQSVKWYQIVGVILIIIIVFVLVCFFTAL